MFLVDIILMFHTSFLDTKGNEVFEMGEIASDYTSQLRFKIDCMAMLGSAAFTWIHPYFTLLGLFKVMRIFRLTSLISKSNVDMTTKTAMNLGKLIFYLVFYLHIIGCYWWICLQYGQGKRYYGKHDQGVYISDDG